MSKPSTYGQMLILMDGILLVEAASCEVSNENKDQDVETLVKGFSGVTPSPDKTMIKVESFVPSTGFEVDLQAREKARKVTEISLVMLGSSGQKLNSRGFVRNVSVKSGVGQNSTVSFDFVGEPANFQ